MFLVGTTQALEVTKGVADFGFLVVAGGFFITMSFIQQWINNRRYDNLLAKNEERYSVLLNQVMQGVGGDDLLTKITELTKATHDLIPQVDKLIETSLEVAREECTYAQANRVIKSEMRLMLLSLNQQTKQIIIKNSIHDKENHTEEKVRKVVCNSLQSMKAGLNLYKYQGQKLGYNFAEDYTENLKVTIYSFIMSSNRDYDKLSSDLEIISNQMQNEIREVLEIF